jgi:hypothetical protein
LIDELCCLNSIRIREEENRQDNWESSGIIPNPKNNNVCIYQSILTLNF